ncbi:MAG: peptide ABC transporter [Chloroflexi bacterium]|nr:MAG: peptide ABC transporter [Chloroflexota bacterium]
MLLAACPAATTTAPTAAETPAAEAAATEAPAAEGAAEGGRGADGTLTILYWQAVSIMNPYLSTGTKDFHAASLVLEPLFNYDPDGNLVPTLAEDIPTVANGGISEDLLSVTWKLKEGVLWSDGTPLTSADLVFTWQYCTDPEVGCASATSYEGVTNVEAVDDLTVKITFDAPKPFPYNPFGGNLAPVLQKAQFENCMGAAAQGCSEQNTYPIGTGPFKVKDFRANDVVTFEANENFREPDKPHFAEVIFKGGGDAAAAARAVLETGEADYAWNLQVEPQILADMEAAGVGTLVSAFAGNVERILINFTNPSADLGDMRSEWTPDNPNPHPILSDIKVRQALSMAIDRNVIAEQLYGAGGRPTCNILSGPPAVVSTANDSCLTQDLEGAKALLEEAGWTDSDGDGIRDKDGMKLSLVYVTSTNQVRQKTQALIKQWWNEIGVETELRNVDAAVYFGGDPASPDTLGKFYADVQMFTNGPDNPDPQNYLGGWICTREEPGDNIARAANNWLGNNNERWCSEEYDALFHQLTEATDAAERAQIAMQLNDMLAQNYVNLPLVFRASPSAWVNTLGGIGALNGWDSEEWNIKDWYRIK